MVRGTIHLLTYPMWRTADRPPAVKDVNVTTRTTSPVRGALTTRPDPTYIPTCPGAARVPSVPGVRTRSPGRIPAAELGVPSRTCCVVTRPIR